MKTGTPTELRAVLRQITSTHNHLIKLQQSIESYWLEGVPEGYDRKAAIFAALEATKHLRDLTTSRLSELGDGRKKQIPAKMTIRIRQNR